MKRDYTGKAIPNIISGDFYNASIQNQLVFSGISNFQATITANPSQSYSWQLPTTQGAAGTVLLNDGSGNLSWVPNTGSGGSVVSVAVSAPAYLGVTGSPITTSGTFTFTPLTTGTGNLVLSVSPTISDLQTTGVTVMTSTSLEPLDIFNPTMTTTQALRIYFGRSETTSNCGQLSFFYNGDGSGNNYIGLGHFGAAERLLIYPGTNVGTIPSVGSVLVNQFRCNSITSTGFVAATGALGESSTVAGTYIGMSGSNAKIELVSATNSALSFIDFTTASPALDYKGRIIYNHTNDTMAFETAGAQRVVLSSAGLLVLANLVLGTTNTTTIVTAASASYSFRLPTTAGTTGQVLTSAGGGSPMTWTTSSVGSVTSVEVTVPSFMSVTGSPITSSGTIAISASSTGSGSVVLQTSPTLITPTLGVASCTSLVSTSFVGARGALSESNVTAGAYIGMSGSNAKMELVAATNTNVGFIDFTTASPSPDFVGRILYNHNTNAMEFSTGGVLRMTLVGGLFDVTSEIRATEIEILKSSVPRLDINPTSGTGSTSLATATAVNNFITGVKVGDSVLYSQRDLILGNSNSSLYSTIVYGALNVSSFIRRTPSITAVGISASVGLTPSVQTVVNNLSVIQTVGEALTINAGAGTFTNNLGRILAVTISYLGQRGGTLGATFMYILKNGVGIKLAHESSQPIYPCSNSTTMILNPGESFAVYVVNDSTFGEDLLIFELTYVIH